MPGSRRDVFVAFGVPNHKRPIYKLWEEGVVPAFVMEVASVSTWREDDGRKAELYERLGVPEYWQYDPTGEYLGLKLKGRRLMEGAYVPQPVVESIDGTLLLRSETLDLDFRVKGEESHFFDPATGERLLSRIDQLAARDAAESRAAVAESRAEAAESRADAAALQADAAALQADAAESRADAAESRARAAEAELAATQISPRPLNRSSLRPRQVRDPAACALAPGDGEGAARPELLVAEVGGGGLAEGAPGPEEPEGEGEGHAGCDGGRGRSRGGTSTPAPGPG